MRRWRISVIIIRCGAAFRLLCMVVGPPMQSLRCSNIWGMPHYFYFPTPIIPDFSKIATPGPIGPDPFSIITLYGKIRSTHNVYVYHLPLRRCTANYVTPIIFIFIINHCNGVDGKIRYSHNVHSGPIGPDPFTIAILYSKLCYPPNVYLRHLSLLGYTSIT